MATSIDRRTSASTQLSYLSNIPSLPRDTPITRLSLMIHGWTCQASHYIPLITLLSKQGFGAENGYLYVAVDLPGHGQSGSAMLPDPENGRLIDLMKVFFEELLVDLRVSGAVESNQHIPFDFYAHSMGTRVGFGLYSFLSESTHDVWVSPSHFIFLDGSYTSPEPPEPIDISVMEKYQDALRGKALAGIHKYFGSRTSESFRTESMEFVAKSDFGYLLRMAHWYRGYDCFIPQLMYDFSSRNQRLVSAGREPVMILNIQGQEVGPDGRHGIKKDFVTKYMSLLRDNLTPWVTEYVIEEASHFIHVDDVEEVAAQLEHLQVHGATLAQQAKL